MAGTLINVVPRTTYDFGVLSTGSAKVIVGGPFDVSQYQDVNVLVRVHSVSITSGNELAVSLFEDGFVEGSDTPYVSPASLTGVVLTSANVAPSLAAAQGNTTAQFVSVGLEVTKSVAGNLMATISVDLLAKSADPFGSNACGCK
jgi:hypothetical protein